MAKAIKPVLEYEQDQGYPGRHGADRRSFLKLALLGAAGSLGGCVHTGARGNKGVQLVSPPAGPPTQRPAPRSPTPPAAPTPPTFVILRRRAATAGQVVVLSDDPRFLRFLADPGRQAFLQRHADPSNPGNAAQPTARMDIIGRRLVSYFRMRTGRRTSRPRITRLRPSENRRVEALFEEGDPPSALGVPRPPHGQPKGPSRGAGAIAPRGWQ